MPSALTSVPARKVGRWLARELHDMHLVIRRAKIGTSLDQVVDVFYLTNRDGEKIEDGAELERIRTQLLAIVDAE